MFVFSNLHDANVIPTIIRNPLTTINASMTIESSVEGSSREINGNNLGYGTGSNTVGINISSGDVTFTETVALQDCFINITGGDVVLAGPIANSSPLNPTIPNIFISSSATTLSGENSSNAQVITLYGNNPTLTILGPISELSVLSLVSSTATVNIGLDLTLTEPQLLYASAVINTSEGCTFTMDSVEPLATYPPSSTPLTLTLNGPGTYVVSGFYIGQDLIIDGVLGGTNGLILQGISSTMGTLTLNGVNTYEGPTVLYPTYDSTGVAVAGVTLDIASGASIGTLSSPTAVTIDETCILSLSGTVYGFAKRMEENGEYSEARLILGRLSSSKERDEKLAEFSKRMEEKGEHWHARWTMID